MLKKFFLNALSSFVGAWLAFVLFGICAGIVTIGIVSQVKGSKEVASVKKHSILTLELSGAVEETETPVAPDYLSLLQGDLERPKSLNVIVECLKDAAANKSVDALYIKCGALTASPATVNAIREAVIDFKQSGKKVYAYGEVYTLGTYYVASVADKVFLNPYGHVAIKGLGSTSLFMKGLFDKLGIQFQVVKVGTFKSAVEPYISNEMSQPARAQLDTLFSTMWSYMKSGICSYRKKLQPERIDSLVNSGLMFSSSSSAKECGFVDELAYERVMDKKLASLLDIDEKKLNFISPSALVGQIPWTNAYSNSNQIAILYATGEIVDGASTGINYQKLVPIIVDLAENENVKGLVLRVNSPGGSAYGSDQIGEALDYFQSKKKPLAVSMGDYAASGGYWISCGANRIFADPLTVTGSIGIFGLIPNASGLAGKIGVNPQSVSTNPVADFPTFTAPLDDKQLDIMQRYVERGYDRFISRVAKGRHMNEERVRAIAEGRVWNAIEARNIGLVDTLASLNAAIDWTATKADVRSKYKVAIYPLVEPSIWDVVYAGQTATAKAIAGVCDGDYSLIAAKVMREIFSRSRIQARMPEFDISM